MHELMKILEESCEFAHEELKELMKKLKSANTVNPSDIQMFDYLTHSIKSIKTVMSMIEYDDRGDSQYSGSRYYKASHMPMYSGDNYSRDNYSRDGYSMENYSGRMYSRDGEKSNAVRSLEGMMRNARNEQDAMLIRDAINSINRIKEY